MKGIASRTRRHASGGLLVLAILSSAGCGSLGGGGNPDPPAWHYQVDLSPGLKTMQVTVRFDQPPTNHLILGDDAGHPAIVDLRGQPGGKPLILDEKGTGWNWVGDEPLSAITYGVDLERLSGRARSHPGQRPRRAQSDVVVTTGQWLVRPDRLPGPHPGEIAFAAARSETGTESKEAAPLRASFPAPGRTSRTADGRPADVFHLDRTAFWYEGTTAFGHLQRWTTKAAGATFEVSVLSGARRATNDGLTAWVGRCAETVAGLYQGFPKPWVRLLVRPSGRGGEPIVFGTAERGGGSSVMLYLAQNADDAALADDWVTVHEMAHLGMPPMPDDDAWLSEGWITWYTDVLRARAGLRSEQEAWRSIVQGFSSGWSQSNGLTLRDASRDMSQGQRWLQVYWGGAATALALDEELRRTSDGMRSLDDAIREIHRWTSGDDHLVTAAEILDHLDSWAGSKLFTSTVQPLLESPTFPDWTPILGRLGVAVHGRDVTLDDTAPHAAFRRALMAPAASGTDGTQRR